MNIPYNNDKIERKTKLVNKIIDGLNENGFGCASVEYDGLFPEEMGREIGNAFKERGYYARLTFFKLRDEFSQVSVSKTPFSENCGSKVYYEYL